MLDIGMFERLSYVLVYKLRGKDPITKGYLELILVIQITEKTTYVLHQYLLSVIMRLSHSPFRLFELHLFQKSKAQLRPVTTMRTTQ